VTLAPFQRTLAAATFAAEREICAVLPRGSAKSTTAALLALHHVITHEQPSVFIGAGSRLQARVIGRIVDRFARHPAIADQVIVRHDELRVGAETALLIVASDGGQAHGWERPTLMIGDEVWSWSEREPTLLGAMRTALIKNPESKLLLISTAAASLATPLGALRARALGLPTVKRRGAHIDARGDGLRWLEWSLPDNDDPDDARAVKRCNPAPWISTADLAAQRRRVTDAEYLQFHCCRWGVGEGSWLSPGAWNECVGESEFIPGEDVWVGVDVGAARSASAVVAVNAQLHVDAWIYHGDEGVLDCIDKVRELAGEYNLRELAADPWRFGQASLELEREGISVTAFPQTDVRMVPASDRLYRAIVERRLVLPDNDELRQHAAAAITRVGRRGGRIDKAHRSDNVDGIVALCMALEAVENQPTEVQLLGWL